MQFHSAAVLALLLGVAPLGSWALPVTTIPVTSVTPAPPRARGAAQERPVEEAPVPVERERHSKVPFAVRYEVPGVKQTFRLAGMGVRTKTVFNVKVYAMGYYLEPVGAAKALAKWKGVPHAELVGKGEFYGALLQDGFGRCMRLVMTRKVDPDDMRDAFEEELRPRLKHAATEWDMQGGEKALETFRTYFEIEALKNGTELVFTWMPDGVLHTSVGGVVKPTIQNKALCWALFDIWFGEQKLAKKVKAGLVRWAPEIIAEQGLPLQRAKTD